MDTMHTHQHATTTSALVVPGARNGPPGMGNGGWTSGLLAAHLGGSPGGPAVEVTLRRPAPLDTALTVVQEGIRAALHDGEPGPGTLVAEATIVDRELQAPAPIDHDAVTAAEAGFLGFVDHPFPTCVICGTQRHPHQGLRIFPGPVAGRPGTVAGWWRPSPNMVDHSAADGRILDAAVWGALDCPTGWAHAGGGGVALLGRLTAQILQPVHHDVDLVVVAESLGRDGRKLHARAGLFGVDGQVFARSEAVWIEVSPDLVGAAGG